MKVLRDQSRCPSPPEGTVVTIGAYDGVHLGHRAVIELVRQRAAERGLRSAVVTFDRHPASIVRPESAPRLLTDLDQKLELLAETGVDYCLVVTFDEARSKEPADEFVREALVEGDLDSANALLGRHYEVRGVVARGDRSGTELGFPTANVSVPGDILLPADGAYAGRFDRAGGPGHPALVSLGRRPMFYAESHVSLLEAHLLDFDGDLYGEHVKVRFVARLRGDERFESIEKLVAQARRARDQVRGVLGPPS